ncbi:ubiquinol oxidase subunit II [Marinobacterium mangrovicola]|uniref:Ubiquinol oxidase subunit 2 n=1 Tax=Marinobacterium mangrovicola TaxID=1476959 RepID=A0A4R1GDA3_9GAMM|nr:ubiquinol oxidase subunit II [Marinobacterium mangrovicola]TCK05818.1 cytochrome bo3 quinol oxidase subunit 2 [Marinobacterium mangrovicola]
MKDRASSLVRGGILLLLTVVMAGCKNGVLDPKGQVAADVKSLIITATLLMLIVVIPVIVLTLVFAWKYRASNTKATYTPKWAHSTKIELVVWLVPCLIIIVLGTLTWRSTHELDPYQPLKGVAGEEDPLTVEVVSLDWKWLFIYPEQQIATVNKLVIPAHRQVAFKITSDSVMNSFFIPQLGSQIYSMAGMETKLHLIADEPGTYDGFSANYSGGGFTGMNFKTDALASEADFDAWVEQVRAGSEPLNQARYEQLAERSINHPVETFSDVEPGLFTSILQQYMTMPSEGEEGMHGMEMHEEASTHGQESADADKQHLAQE